MPALGPQDASTALWRDAEGWTTTGSVASPQASPREDGNRCGRTPDELRLAEVRQARWEAREALWSLSSLKSSRHCRRVRAAGHELLTVNRTGGVASIGGTQTCKSVSACPICSARINGGRTEDLAQALAVHRGRGGKVIMGTFTLQHRSQHALGDLWDVISYAWKAARGGNRSSRRALAAMGTVGWVRNVEATHGPNGWHVHVHVLFFVGGHQQSSDNGAGLPTWAPIETAAGDDEAVQDFGRTLFAAWRGAVKHVRDTVQEVWPEHSLASMGLPSDRHGWDARVLDLSDALGEAASYLAKGEYTGAMAASLEMTAGGKVGRHGALDNSNANRTPMQILADVVDREEMRDLVLWRQWEQAARGRRLMTWDQKLRDRLALGALATDDELADEGEADESLIGITPEGYRAVTNVRGRVGQVVRAAESDPAPDVAREAVTVLLAGWGLWSQIREAPQPLERTPAPARMTRMHRPHGDFWERLGGNRGDRYAVPTAADRYR